MRAALVLLVAAAAILPACGPHAPAPPAEKNEPEPQSITRHSARTEAYVEFPPLVAGKAATFAVHLTRLTDFRPVASGKVALQLGSGDRAEVAVPSSPGIFNVSLTPSRPGRARLSLGVESDGWTDPHEFGEVVVHADAAAAARAATEKPAAAGRIKLSKEQQWQTDFSTALVGEQALRESVLVFGALRARPEGDAVVSAPAAGRVAGPGAAAAFVHVGQEVARDQVLAQVAPRLAGGDADVASLQLAREKATVGLSRARRERERLEELLKTEAVPARRVEVARSEEAALRAELDAAERRLGQYRGTQRTAGRGAQERVQVRSPITGAVAEVQVAPGSFVEEGKPLFHVVDTARLWLEARVPEGEVIRLEKPTGAWFELERQTGTSQAHEATAPVAFGAIVDATSRTAPLIFEVQNPERRLKVGAMARVHVYTGRSSQGPVIPAAALVDEDGLEVAYVQVEGESFERRILRLGIRDRGVVEVREGVRAGERVVVKGAYLVRLASLSAQGGAPAGHGHAH
jgi:RND family efflux transporter MFP subunit